LSEDLRQATKREREAEKQKQIEIKKQKQISDSLRSQNQALEVRFLLFVLPAPLPSSPRDDVAMFRRQLLASLRTSNKPKRS
jgi:hypothetical protein